MAMFLFLQIWLFNKFVYFGIKNYIKKTEKLLKLYKRKTIICEILLDLFSFALLYKSYSIFAKILQIFCNGL